MSRPFVSIVSPVYGCRDCLESLVERVIAAVAPVASRLEIILVDDASPDRAWQRIEELSHAYDCVRGLRLSRNFGQHAAISAGIEHARGDCVVVMDCDLQDLPEEIPRLLAAHDGSTELVLARRAERVDGWRKRLSSRGFYGLLSWLTGVRHDPAIANFGIYSRKLIDVVNRMPEVERFFPLMVRWTGFPAAHVDVRHGNREIGRSSYGLMRMLRLALNVVLSYSDKPLRLVVKAGLAFSLLAVLFAALSVYRYFSGDIAVAGFTSIIASIWLLGGVMVSSIGVVGLYVGRIFNDTKGRPYYVVDRDTAADEAEPAGSVAA
jgi:polyisoprenyl-phosphate glycosyltransferase